MCAHHRFTLNAVLCSSQDNQGSVPKRPVRPSLGSDGTDCSIVPKRAPGTDGYLGVRPDCRCLRWRDFLGNSG